MEDVGHHLIGGQRISGVERVNYTLFGLTERAGARDATQHEEAEVVGMDGRGTINKLIDLIIIIERLPHEVDVVSEGLTTALPKHAVVQQGERSGKGPAVQSFTQNIPCCSCAVGMCM
jgi:hypothetical protein